MTPLADPRIAPTAARRVLVLVTVMTMLATFLSGVGPAQASSDEGEEIGVIVREMAGAGDGPEELVERLGGEVGVRLDVIEGFAATIPANVLATLTAHPGVLSVTPDARLQLTGGERDDDHDRRGSRRLDEGWADETEDRKDSGTLRSIDEVIRATYLWRRGFTGAGVGVALIDSGIAPVEGLTVRGKVINGPDLSFDSQSDALRYLDLYGHGTHLAGIIAGRDDGVSRKPRKADLKRRFVGVAPGARILNVKVADGGGAADVSQVIAAIDWVVQHRNDRGMNVRVLNLAFGTDGVQDYVLDPLAYAVEVAWRKGIVVVVAAGNDGNASPLRNPASDPFVIAVGADDTQGTRRTSDDVVPGFVSCGTTQRPVDLLAPGRSVVSLRVPGSYADVHYPDAAVGERFFRGTGTSQAAAVVSGAVALLLQQRPDLTPDQVKALLVSTARPVPAAPGGCGGAGLIDLEAASKAPTPDAVQDWEPSTGLGSLEAARGSYHVVHEGVPLEGEQDIFGNPWDGASWSGASWSGASWSGGEWNGASWSGASWSGASWSRASWSGASWSGASWSGASWSGASWSGASWSGDLWATIRWG